MVLFAKSIKLFQSVYRLQQHDHYIFKFKHLCRHQFLKHQTSVPLSQYPHNVTIHNFAVKGRISVAYIKTIFIATPY
jgi:hypothetical protein